MTRMDKTSKTANIKCEWGCRTIGTLIHCSWECKKTISYEVKYMPVLWQNPFLHVYPKEKKNLSTTRLI